MKKLGSPNKQKIIFTDGINRLPKPHKIEAIKLVQENVHSEIEAEICAKLAKNYKDKYGEKSEIAYDALSVLAQYFRGKKITYIQKQLGVAYDNARKIRDGLQLGRKVYNRVINNEVVEKIVNFFEDDRISRVYPSLKRATKKLE